MSRFQQRLQQRMSDPEFAAGFDEAERELSVRIPRFTSTRGVEITSNSTAGSSDPAFSFDGLEGLSLSIFKATAA